MQEKIKTKKYIDEVLDSHSDDETKSDNDEQI